MPRINFFQGLISPKKIEQEYGPVLKSLLTDKTARKTLCFEKKIGSPGSLPLFTIRPEGKSSPVRLLFTAIKIHGESRLVVLELSERHYKDSRFLDNRHLLVEHLRKNYMKYELAVSDATQSSSSSSSAPSPELVFIDESTDELPPELEQALTEIDVDASPETLGWWFNKNIVIPDATQIAAASFSVPKFITGRAGTGKSMLLNHLLEQAKLSSSPGQIIACITRYPSLLKTWEDNWRALDIAADTNGASVRFLSLLQWIHEMNPALSNRTKIAGLTEFSEWHKRVNTQYKSGPLSNANYVYQEMRVCSGYTREQYLALSGKDKSLTAKEDRAHRIVILDIVAAWTSFVETNDPTWIDISFVKLNIKDKVDLLFFDELQDCSPGIANYLLQYCQKDSRMPPAFIAAGDELQRLHDEKSLFSFIRQSLFDKKFPKDAQALLDTDLRVSYRPFHGLEETLNRLLQHHKTLLGKSRVQQTGGITLADGLTSRPGRMDWFKTPPAEVLEDIRQTAAINPKLVIITLPHLIEEARTYFGTPNVTSIEEFKGLEGEIVVAWRFFEDPDIIQASVKLQQLNQKKGGASSRAAPKSKSRAVSTCQNSFPELSTAMSRLYTLYTRPLRRMITINPPSKKDHQLNWLIEDLKQLSVTHPEWRPLGEDFAPIEPQQAWNNYVIELIRDDRLRLAEALFRQYLPNHGSEAFYALCKEYGMSVSHAASSHPVISSSGASSSVPVSTTRPNTPVAKPVLRKVNKQAEARLEQLMDTKNGLLYQALTAKAGSVKKVRNYLEKCIDGITLEQLTRQLYYITHHNRLSLLSWLCLTSEESCAFFVVILKRNEALLDELCASILSLKEKCVTAHDNKKYFLQSLGFMDKSQGKDTLEILSAKTGLGIEEIRSLTQNDQSPEHKLFYKGLYNTKPSDWEMYHIQSHCQFDDNLFLKKVVDNLVSFREKATSELYLSIHQSQDFVQMINSYLDKTDRLIADQKYRFDELAAQIRSAAPNSRKDILAIIERMKGNWMTNHSFCKLDVAFAVLENHLQTEQEFLDRLVVKHRSDWPVIVTRYSQSCCSKDKFKSELNVLHKMSLPPTIFFISKLREVSYDELFGKHAGANLACLIFEYSKSLASDSIPSEVVRLHTALTSSSSSLSSSSSSDTHSVSNTENELQRCACLIKNCLQTLSISNPFSGFLRVALDKLKDYDAFRKAMIEWNPLHPVLPNKPVGTKTNVKNTGNHPFFAKKRGKTPVLSSASSRKAEPEADWNINHWHPNDLKLIYNYYFEEKTPEHHIRTWSLLIVRGAIEMLVSIFYRHPGLHLMLQTKDLFCQLKANSKENTSLLAWLCKPDDTARHTMLSLILEDNISILGATIDAINCLKNNQRPKDTNICTDLLLLANLETTETGRATLSGLMGYNSELAMSVSNLIIYLTSKYTVGMHADFLSELNATPESHWQDLLEKRQALYPDDPKPNLIFKGMLLANNEARKDWNATDKSKMHHQRLIDITGGSSSYLLKAEIFKDNSAQEVFNSIELILRTHKLNHTDRFTSLLRVVLDELRTHPECLTKEPAETTLGI